MWSKFGICSVRATAFFDIYNKFFSSKAEFCQCWSFFNIGWFWDWMELRGFEGTTLCLVAWKWPAEWMTKRCAARYAVATIVPFYNSTINGLLQVSHYYATFFKNLFYLPGGSEKWLIRSGKKIERKQNFRINQVMLKWDIILLIFLQCAKDKKVKHVLHD